MNTYRVKVRRNDLSVRTFSWDVDASHPASAISKALQNIAVGSGDLDISVRLFASHVPWDAATKPVREVA